MNYINKDERVKSRRQFILLFSLEVILTVTVASAFFIPLKSKQLKEVPVTKVPAKIITRTDTMIKEVLVTDTVSNQQVIALLKKLDEKNGQVVRLQQQVKNLQQQVNSLHQVTRQTINKPVKSFNEINFLKLALRSQTSQIDKLRRDNESLRQQINK